MLIGGRAHNLKDIETIGAMDLSFAEISLLDPEQVERDYHFLLRLKEKYKFFYLAHGPEEGDPWNVKGLRTNLLPRIHSLTDWAQRLGIGIFTMHFWLDSRFIQKEIIIKKIALLKEMVDYAASKKVILSIENLSESSKDLSASFEQIPALGFTLDIGHGELLTDRNTAYGFIHDYPNRIKHVHVHDNQGGNSPVDDLHLSIGDGVIDFASILKALAETGYNDTITLEVNISEMQSGKREIETKFLSRT